MEARMRAVYLMSRREIDRSISFLHEIDRLNPRKNTFDVSCGVCYLLKERVWFQRFDAIRCWYSTGVSPVSFLKCP